MGITETITGWTGRGRRIARAAAVACMGAGLLLGGCNNNLKNENAALMQENAQLREQNSQLAANNSAFQQQLDAMRSQPAGYMDQGGDYNSGGVSTRTSGRETVIEIAGDVLFDSGQATLKPTARRELDRVAANIRSRHSGRALRIVGHTDTDPIRKSKWASNEALSKARAEAVADYLSSKGISRSMISTVGRGAAEPRATKQASRRVEVVIVDMQ
ncbi:MAG: OmpA family protein [Phycisphaeraceae bacterium]|nr:OmpA family protein [Phycisphaeraceae bacterium]